MQGNVIGSCLADFEAIHEEFKAQFSEEELDVKGAFIDPYYHYVEKEAMRRSILDEGKRLDGRKTTETVSYTHLQE